MDEGDGVAGVGQQVVLNANLEKVGHREVLGRHLGIPTSFFTYQEKGVRFLREKVGHKVLGRHLGIPTKFKCVRLLLIYKNILSDKIFMANFLNF